MKEIATIFNIQRFSIHDGPGIRTTVFFKGCNLRCQWCHNPEAFHAAPQMEFDKRACVGCGRCIDGCQSQAITLREGLCETNRAVCTNCLKCIAVCPYSARKQIGEELTLEEVMTHVMSDLAYYKNSGGGVTLSGGEPLLWPRFAVELLKQLQAQGVHTAIESALHVKKEVLEQLIPYTDLWLCDFKVMDSKKHQLVTGVTNERIKENFKYLSEQGANVIVRIPVIPNINDDPSNLENTLKFLRDNTHFRKIECLPFHNLGASKYEKLGMDNPYEQNEVLQAAHLNRLKQVIQAYGFSEE